jgi:SpoIID/LytB domain protein
MLDQLSQEIRGTGPEPVTLIGSSLGGTLAILAAERRTGVFGAGRMTIAARWLIVAFVITLGSIARTLPADAVVAQDVSVAIPSEVSVGFLRGGSYDVTTIPMETYVARVLAGEAARESPSAALEALAIAIRTFAAANRGRHRAGGFDLCDQTHCQVVRTAVPTTERAALATAGQVLLFDGEPASVFYSASCGGRTERPSGVWPGAVDPPYLPTKPDDACQGQPEWTAELRAVDLQRALAAAGFRGTLRAIRIALRNESGRVARLTIDGLTPGEISGQDLRMALLRLPGVPQVQSASFELISTRDGYRFAGHGYGHGVGMCVIGSVRLASGGVSAASILERYFPGTTLGPGGASGVWLSGIDEGARAPFLALAAAAKDELAAALGVTPPPRIAVRIHPTTADYEQASGRPWFTSGTIVDGEMHLVPVGMLRDRGMLELTVRRQLTRLLTERELANKPLWVREGTALHFGDLPDSPPVARPPIRGSCPSDDELARPVSAGALADAYARARACVERQLGSGRAWREVR